MELIRGIVTGAHYSRPEMTPEQRRLWDEQSRLKEQVQRLDRIDAGIPYATPRRRATDRR